MIYIKAFQSNELGYASALSVILLLLAVLFAWLQIRTLDKLAVD